MLLAPCCGVQTLHVRTPRVVGRHVLCHPGPAVLLHDEVRWVGPSSLVAINDLRRIVDLGGFRSLPACTSRSILWQPTTYCSTADWGWRSWQMRPTTYLSATRARTLATRRISIPYCARRV